MLTREGVTRGEPTHCLGRVRSVILGGCWWWSSVPENCDSQSSPVWRWCCASLPSLPPTMSDGQMVGHRPVGNSMVSRSEINWTELSYFTSQFGPSDVKNIMGDFEGGQPKKKNLQVEPGAGPSSLFILSDTNFIRRFTLFLIEWPPFEYTILLTIIGELTFKLKTKESV